MAELELDEAIKAGTLALMMCLYGEDLGGAATGDAYEDERQMHREQVSDVLRAAAPLIVAATRRQVAEEIAAIDIETPDGLNLRSGCCEGCTFQVAIDLAVITARGRGETQQPPTH